MRQTWLRGRGNVHKRCLLHVAGHNLGLLMFLLMGAGTPREASAWGLAVLLAVSRDRYSFNAMLVLIDLFDAAGAAVIVIPLDPSSKPTSSTGC